MSILTLVHHGQMESFVGHSHPLSQLGRQQAQLLGRYWASQDYAVHQVYLGSHRLHRQTHELTRTAYQEYSKNTWPEAVMVPDFNDHQGPQVFRSLLPQLPEAEQWLARLGRALLQDEASLRRAWLETSIHVTRKWVRGEIDAETIEPWPAFRVRVVHAVERILKRIEEHERAVIFTSAGVVGAVVGHALKLKNEGILQLGWTLRNTAVCELFTSKRQLSLSTFNLTAHLPTAELLTYL